MKGKGRKGGSSRAREKQKRKVGTKTGKGMVVAGDMRGTAFGGGESLEWMERKSEVGLDLEKGAPMDPAKTPGEAPALPVPIATFII